MGSNPEFDGWADCIPSGPSQPQLDFLSDLGLELGVDLLAEASDLLGWEVHTLKALSVSDAHELISSLKERRSRF